MFKNIGKKIQAVSSTIFIIQSLLGILLGMSIGAAIGAVSDEAGPAIMGALVVIAIFIFLAWLSQLVLYAYGKITECSEEQCRLLRQLIVLNGGTVPDPTPKKRVCSCGATLEEDAIFCQNCGKRWE